MTTPAPQRTNRPFPSPKERERIVQRRSRLMRALIEAMVIWKDYPERSDPQIRILIAEYGTVEFERMRARLAYRHQAPADFDAEEAWLYDEYVKLHQRFGGRRPLLASEELNNLKAERAKLLIRRDFMGETLSTSEEHRFVEIGDLILADADLWDDLVPEDPPATHELLPPSREPGRNAPCWCGSGRKYKHCHLRADETR